MQKDKNSPQLQSLLDRGQAGSCEAYDELIERSADRLKALVKRMLRNYPQLHRWEQTDDVFQNALIRLHKSLSEVRPDSVRGFLGLASLQIRRTLIDLARHHFGPHGQHAKYHSGGDTQLQETTRAESDEPQTLESWATFHERVAQMPDAEREVLELVWYHELQHSRIAELLGVSVSTVKRKLRNARLFLADAFDEADE